MKLFNRKPEPVEAPREMTWEESAHLISLPADLNLDTKCMVIVEDNPELGDVFDSHHAAALYVTWLASHHKVQGTIRPLA